MDVDLTELRAFLAALIRDDPSPCLVADEQGAVHAWNAPAEAAAGLAESALSRARIAWSADALSGAGKGGATLELAGRAHAASVRMLPRLGEAWPTLYAVRLLPEAARRDDDGPKEVGLTEAVAERAAGGCELEEFSAFVSHELRTPMRFANRIAHMVLREHAERLPYDVVQRVEMIIECTRQVSALIDDLLAFSRVVRQTAEMRTVDMGALARSVAAELTRDAADRDIRVDFAPMPRAVGDRDLLRHVFANLIGNALKFTRPRAQARIAVGGRKAGGEAVYFVRDNGVGFDPARAGALFGLFQRLHTPDAFEGTGVGLALAKRIVERHGGRIWAESAPDAGATFWFALPRRTSARPGASNAEAG